MNVQEALVPVSGTRVGCSALCCCVTLTTDTSLTGWEMIISDHSAHSLWEGHHLSSHINSGSFSGFETLPSCACLHRQHIGCLVHKQIGRSAVMFTLQTGTPDPPVVPGKVAVPEDSLYTGLLNQGADILSRQRLRPGEWRLHPEFVRWIWSIFLARLKSTCLRIWRPLTVLCCSPSHIRHPAWDLAMVLEGPL